MSAMSTRLALTRERWWVEVITMVLMLVPFLSFVASLREAA
jgi:hypothetical protein